MLDLTALLLLIPVFAFGGGPSAPPPNPPPPQKTDAEIQAERNAEKRRILRRRGRASTILAGEISPYRGGGYAQAAQRLLASTEEGKQTLG